MKLKLTLQAVVLPLFTIFFSSISLKSFSQSSCGCDIVIKPSPTDGTAYLDGNNLGVKPGNKVCLMAGHYIDISLTHFSGAPGKPVTIVNCGGLVTVSGYNAYGFGLHTSRYVHVTGSGDPNYKYGILIDGSVANTSVGFAEDMQVSDVELDHMEVSKAGEAVACEPTPSCDPFTWGSSWKMYNMSFHDNYIHDTFFEGFYIGNTQNDYNYTCSGSAVTVHPVLFDTVKFYNNIIDKAGWTGAQISEVVGFLDCHDNTFTNYGYLNKSQHQAGLIIGGNSHGNIYRNKIIGGTGNAFECFAAGLTKVYNNIFANAGFDGTAEGQNAVLIDDRPRYPSNLPPLQIYFINNTIVNAARVAITFYNDYGTVGTGNIIANNLISQPGYYKVYPNFAFLYMQAGMSVTVSNNINAPTNAEVNYVNAANNDFHLLAGSKAINAGMNVGAYGVTSDYDNVQRPYGAAYDVGAFEYNSGNQPPIAKVGAKQTITLPTSSVSLDGSKSTDPDGSIASYSWSQSSGPAGASIASATSATTNVTGLSAGTYIFKLTVTDNKGATGSALDTIVVNTSTNQSPVANAGADQTITLPVTTVTVNGSASNDPGGSITKYAWSLLSGPSKVSIVSASSVSTAINNLIIPGIYVVKLTVTDNSGKTASDYVAINVKGAANQAPVANAGADQTIASPASTVIVSGSASTDAGGSIVKYAWSLLSGPSKVSIASPSSVTTAINNLVPGIYVFKLTVTDNNGATTSDYVAINVKAAGSNNASVVNADTGQAISEIATGEQMIVYPNPALSSSIHLRLISDALGTIKISIYDMRGRLITAQESDKEQSLYDKELDISKLARGMYTVQAVIGANKTMVAKFSKQ